MHHHCSLGHAASQAAGPSRNRKANTNEFIESENAAGLSYFFAFSPSSTRTALLIYLRLDEMSVGQLVPQSDGCRSNVMPTQNAIRMITVTMSLVRTLLLLISPSPSA